MLYVNRFYAKFFMRQTSINTSTINYTLDQLEIIIEIVEVAPEIISNLEFDSNYTISQLIESVNN